MYVHTRNRPIAMSQRLNNPSQPTSSPPVVLVVDDDSAMRESLDTLLRSVDLEVRTFASAAELLRSELPDTVSCLVLDVRLPGLNGLDFQVQLAQAGIHMPIIFMTGHGDIPMTVQAMKGGAVDFLAKPFREQDLLNAVTSALELDVTRRQNESAQRSVRQRIEALTAREREVMGHVTNGLLNKQIAAEMGLSEMTVKIYRGHMMRKMSVRSVAELVKLCGSVTG